MEDQFNPWSRGVAIANALWDLCAETPSTGPSTEASTQSRKIRLRFTTLYPDPFISIIHQLHPEWLTFTRRVLATGPHDEEKGSGDPKEGNNEYFREGKFLCLR